MDGALVVPKPEVCGDDGADLAPGSVFRWPPCECGAPQCPDYVAPEGAR